jgi:hypothetical protein
MLDSENSGQEDFLEVHILGPFTIHSVERVALGAISPAGTALLPALKEHLQRWGIELDEPGTESGTA